MAASSCPSPLVNLGLPRTGTTSLHLAVTQLGLRSLHASDLDAATLGALAAAALDLSNSTLPPLLNSTLASYDAAGSAPWFALAGVLPRRSTLKFVATTRDEASWLASARWLFGDPLFRFGHPPAVQRLLAYLGGASTSRAPSGGTTARSPRSRRRASTCGSRRARAGARCAARCSRRRRARRAHSARWPTARSTRPMAAQQRARKRPGDPRALARAGGRPRQGGRGRRRGGRPRRAAAAAAGGDGGADAAAARRSSRPPT